MRSRRRSVSPRRRPTGPPPGAPAGRTPRTVRLPWASWCRPRSGWSGCGRRTRPSCGCPARRGGGWLPPIDESIQAMGTRDLSLDHLVTAGGRTLAGVRLRYRVIGDTDAARDNGWILVFHALTGSADVEAWWGPLVGPGRPLDTTRHAIVSANLLGSCYGSTGPREWAAEHEDGWPELTPGDLAASHSALLEELGVDRLALATGGSLGGMVALEWGRRSPVPVDRLVVFAAPAATSPQAIAWNTVQRMAIEADPGWQSGRYPPGEGPAAGLAAAR